ncbi:choice-of-anchor A family protein [Kitasatospora sp. NBC_00240]|uniref:choice-of-anchor A family protein n=1 Tax=Kitasatospora sp. NBC_00240 TaxID=2903567 RepID=UPI002252530A|nr:choice-of-anchor A family protein [Kitasatospora sp. NBC_00240]MCX5210312.1 choice-of-anchor A family protein [Kitasatospora sp. NBC_00240]
MRISVPAAALALGGSLALGALLAPASHATEAGRQCQSLGVANLYGEFVEGDDTHTPDAEGAVAIGGNADFTGGFTVGQELTAEQVAALPGGNALVVAGNLTGTNTQVMKGNGIYGGTLTGVADAHQGKIVKGTSPIDFGAEFGKLRAASTALAAAPATAGAKVESSGDRLTLTGTDTQVNTFTVAAATLQGAKEVYLNVPAGASTIVNVTGSGYDMAAAGTTGFFLWDADRKSYVLDDKLQSAAGGAVRAKLLWNFPTATKVVKNSAAAWSGSVLAPNAAFDLGSGGPVNGSVIAKSLTGKGGAETHHYPFTGCLPAEVPPVVVPTTPGVPTGSASAPATPGTPGAPAGTSPAATPGTGGTPAPSPSATGSAPATPGAVPSPSVSPSATPSTGGGLALTGAGGALPIAIGGLVVLAAGGGIVVASRRRAAGKA